MRLVGNLRDAAKQYFNLKKDRAQTALELYKTFLKNYIFKIENDKKKIAENLKNFFGKDKIKIASIDGTKYQRLVNLIPKIFSEIRSRQELVEAPLNATGLYFILKEEYSLDEIKKVIDFLSSDLIGALRSEEGEVSTTVEIGTLKQKLKTIIKAIERSEKH